MMDGFTDGFSFLEAELAGGVDAASPKQWMVSMRQKQGNVNYGCDNWDSNPDLEHGKLEFYP